MSTVRAGRQKPLKEKGARKRAATSSERCSHVIVSAERCLKGPSQSCHGEGNRQQPGPERLLDLSGVWPSRKGRNVRHVQDWHHSQGAVSSVLCAAAVSPFNLSVGKRNGSYAETCLIHDGCTHRAPDERSQHSERFRTDELRAKGGFARRAQLSRTGEEDAHPRRSPS